MKPFNIKPQDITPHEVGTFNECIHCHQTISKKAVGAFCPERMVAEWSTNPNKPDIPRAEAVATLIKAMRMIPPCPNHGDYCGEWLVKIIFQLCQNTFSKTGAVRILTEMIRKSPDHEALMMVNDDMPIWGIVVKTFETDEGTLIKAVATAPQDFFNLNEIDPSALIVQTKGPSLEDGSDVIDLTEEDEESFS